MEQILDEIEHRLVVGIRARKAQRLVQRAELLAAATARAPAGAQEPLALGGCVGPEGLAQLSQPPDGARALGNTACLAHARFNLCGRCRSSSSCVRWSCYRCPRGAPLWTRCVVCARARGARSAPRRRRRLLRAAEQRDELAPSDHSITSSAATRSLSGTVKLKAFAVLR